MRIRRRLLAVVVSAALCASCSGDRAADESPASPRPEPRAEPAVERPTPIPEDAVVLHDPALAARHARARACLVRLAPASVWSHHPPGPGPSVREERWCSPDGPCNEATGSFPLGQRSYHVRTLAVGGSAAAAGDERLELVAHETSESEWATTIWLQPWTGGFSFGFVRGDDAFTVTSEHCVPAMDQQICASAEDPIVPVIDWHDREVRAHTATAAALRDRTLAALSRLREAVERAVRSHTLTTCPEPSAPDRFQHVEGNEGATGTADTCVRRALTRTEEQAVLRTARADIAAREALVRRSSAEWHAALVALLPLEQCWLGDDEWVEPTPNASPDDSIEWRLSIEPSPFRLARIADVEIHIRATNRGSVTVDPGRFTLALTIDGESRMDLDMAFGNGGAGPEWRALLPAHTAHDSRIGVRFVDAPGEHVLVLHRAGRELARTAFRVTR